ncbi:MAG TPA: hypothetical protein VHW66_22175 [Stellaceae bacterium]|jgi:hypothetical protein|nr:hypothetical protein [Stellaceae bacterium]
MKARNAILEPDPRFSTMAAGFDAAGAVRMMTVGDLHDQMAEIHLHLAVPPGIAEQFDKARHAYVYSWFAYDLVSLAEQQGYQTLELALREKLPVPEREKADREHWGLGKLFGRAIAHGWLTPRPVIPGTRMTAFDFLVMSRNELAHGSRNLFPAGSVEMLEQCAEILNELFSPRGSNR